MQFFHRPEFAQAARAQVEGLVAGLEGDLAPPTREVQSPLQRVLLFLQFPVHQLHGVVLQVVLPLRVVLRAVKTANHLALATSLQPTNLRDLKIL